MVGKTYSQRQENLSWESMQVILNIFKLKQEGSYQKPTTSGDTWQTGMKIRQVDSYFTIIRAISVDMPPSDKQCEILTLQCDGVILR